MKDQFITYNLAVKLKELGFDEECFSMYMGTHFKSRCYGSIHNCENKELFTPAPLWQQAFKFLLRNLKNRELIVALEFDGEVTLWEVITDDAYKTYNKILASGNKESLEKLIKLYSQLRKEVKS